MTSPHQSDNDEPEGEIPLGPYVRLLLPDENINSVRIFIGGRSKSGKTTLAVEIIRRFLIKRVNRFFVICTTFDTQPTFESIRELADKKDIFVKRPTAKIFNQIREEIEKDLESDPEKKFLLLIDDVASDQVMNTGRKGSFASLAVEAPHIHLSIMALFQQAKACSAAFRNNADDVIFFPPGDKDAIKVFTEEFSPCIFGSKSSTQFNLKAIKVWTDNNFVFIHRPAREHPAAFKNFDEPIPIAGVRKDVNPTNRIQRGERIANSANPGTKIRGSWTRDHPVGSKIYNTKAGNTPYPNTR